MTASENYNITNLPYGDLNYLTMPEETSGSPNMLEPFIEIDTANDNSEPTGSYNMYRKIGECTVSVSSNN